MEDLYYPNSLKDAITRSETEKQATAAIKFSVIKRKSADSADIDRIIYLYMPEQLANPTNVSWDSAGVGQGGASWIEGNSIADATNLGSVGLQKANELVSSMRGKLQGGTGAADGVLIDSLKEKQATNPYLKMAFRNVNFRTFEFSFKFTPHTIAESKEIYQIIQAFRKAAHPSLGGGENPDKNTYRVDYPNEFNIEYIYQGKINPWLNKFKTSVITDMSVNYTGAGFFAQMRDGFPAQSEMRIQFSEIELLYAEDIEPVYSRDGSY